MALEYKHFSRKEVEDWVSFYKTGLPQKGNLNGDFLEALNCYTGSSNIPINSFLRYKKPICYEDKRRLQAMLRNFPYYHVPDNILVYRYINKPLLKYMCQSRPPHKNSIMLDESFMSTTLFQDGVDTYRKRRNLDIMLKIRVPKGACGVYVGLLDTLEEYELILPPNTKLRIESVCYPFRKDFLCSIVT